MMNNIFISRGISNVILLFLLVSSMTVFSQNSTHPDYYNLNFAIEKGAAFMWEKSHATSCQLDASEMIEGKMPLKFFATKLKLEDLMRYRRRYQQAMKWKYPFEFGLFQTIFLPETSLDSKLEIAVTSKSCHTGKAKLEVVGYDKKENIICTDSVDINHENGWATQTIVLPGKELKYIRLTLWGKGGKLENQEQVLWLDRIRIKLDGKNLCDYPVPCDTCVDKHIRLDDKAIVPLLLPDSFSCNTIPAFGDPGKPIIGLGESLHGGETVSRAILQMMKSLVTERHCKVMMLEKGSDTGLKWDLYVQGLTPDSTINEIREEVRQYKTSLDGMVEFLHWLREYNRKQTEKVHFFGLDRMSDPRVYLFDYFTLLNEGRRDSVFVSFLDTVSGLYVGDIIEFIQKDPTLISGLDKKESDYLQMILKDQYHLMQAYADTLDILADNRHDELRDSFMAARAKWIIGNYLADGEKAVIYAHSGHVNKLNTGLLRHIDVSDRSLGGYLHQEFGDRYYALSFQPGEGIVLQQKTGSRQVEEELDRPPYNSFEYSALLTGQDCFFYPSGAIPDDMFYVRWIANIQVGRGFSFYSIPHRFDGLIFIRENKPVDSGVKNGYDEAMRFGKARHEKRKAYIRKLRKE